MGAIVVIQTRWSENDMIGQLLRTSTMFQKRPRELDLSLTSRLYEDEADQSCQLTVPLFLTGVLNWARHSALSVTTQMP